LKLIRNKNRLKLDFFPAIEHFTKLPKHTYTRSGEADVTSLLKVVIPIWNCDTRQVYITV
jgi:hypothetical protein